MKTGVLLAGRYWPHAAALLLCGGYAWYLSTGESEMTRLFWAIPFLLGFFAYLALNLRGFFWLMAACIPISVNINDIGGGVGFALPGELAVWLCAIVLGFQYLNHEVADRRIIRHPLTWLVALHLFWIFITSLTSENNLVSWKLLIARSVFIWVFYVVMFGLFCKPENIWRFFRLYLVPFCFIMLYCIHRMSQYGFSQKFSPAISEPFYSDHTIYGACLALLLPLVMLAWANRHELPFTAMQRSALAPVMILTVAAVLVSYSRAAWLSLMAAAVLYWLLRFRVPVLVIFAGIFAIAFTAYMNRENLLVSSKGSKHKGEHSFLSHAQTVTDLERDESNKERINRWVCAVQMGRERPWVGYGPGTYELYYGTFQSSLYTTRISTKNGDRGDAHSEYLIAFSEQGYPGLIFWLLLVGGTLWTGIRATYRAKSTAIRVAAMGITLGISTYFVHGFVNSFLDIDKAAPLIWASLAALACIDLVHNREQQKPEFS